MLNDSESSISGAARSWPSPDCWNVAYTQPKRERVALDNLHQQGFEAYLPLYRSFKKSKRESLSGFEPMFPRYIFFKAEAALSISAARSTRGVAFVLSFGCRPAVVKDEALVVIRDFERLRNLADVHQISPFRTGAKVRLAGENLHGLEGLVTSVSSKRVNILLEILGAYRKMSVEHHQLELT